MKNIDIRSFLTALFVGCLATLTVQAQGDQDVPPNPEFGKCYAKCKIADKYETVTEEVKVKDASTKLITVPAKYETKEERIMTKPESKRLIAIPAVYETVTEKVLSKPEGKRIITTPPVFETVTETILVMPAGKRTVDVPAVYETVTERIMVSPESGQWINKVDYENCFSNNPEDCTIKCWEKIPARYNTIEKRVLKTAATTKEIETPAENKTITKQVIKTAAGTREETIPAEYKNVTKQVLKTPATTREETIPAEYRTVTKQVLVSAADTREETIPAEFRTITKTNKVSEGGYTDWQEILCKADTSPEMIRRLQSALKDAGFYSGPVDGVMGSMTTSALARYQTENGLPINNLNIKTLRKLGIVN